MGELKEILSKFPDEMIVVHQQRDEYISAPLLLNNSPVEVCLWDEALGSNSGMDEKINYLTIYGNDTDWKKSQRKKSWKKFELKNLGLARKY